MATFVEYVRQKDVDRIEVALREARFDIDSRDEVCNTPHPPPPLIPLQSIVHRPFSSRGSLVGVGGCCICIKTKNGFTPFYLV